jgi:hypothetical protein
MPQLLAAILCLAALQGCSLPIWDRPPVPVTVQHQALPQGF